MDRAALIGRLNGVMLTLFDSWEAEDDEVGKGELVRARETVNDAIATLEADVQKEAALKALCDDLGIGLARLVSGIRAIFGWDATTKDLHTKTTKGDT